MSIPRVLGFDNDEIVGNSSGENLLNQKQKIVQVQKIGFYPTCYRRYGGI